MCLHGAVIQEAESTKLRKAAGTSIAIALKGLPFIDVLRARVRYAGVFALQYRAYLVGLRLRTLCWT